MTGFSEREGSLLDPMTEGETHLSIQHLALDVLGQQDLDWAQELDAIAIYDEMDRKLGRQAFWSLAEAYDGAYRIPEREAA